MSPRIPAGADLPVDPAVLERTIGDLATSEDASLAKAAAEGLPDRQEVADWVERTKRLVLMRRERSSLRSEIPYLADRLRQHLDAVLIYETHYTAESSDNPLSIADWTIVGAFLLPGQSIEASAFASALLVDVRNGYPYGTADTVVDRDTLSTTYGRRSISAELGEQARTAAALSLVEDVEQMMIDLKQELDVAFAPGDEEWR